MLGQTLGHYRINRVLGAGGMGHVYGAEDSRLKRDVALKVLAPDVASDPRRLKRFQREAEAIAALDHPNIVIIYSIEAATPGESTAAEPVHFITMQLVEGRTLGDVLPPQGFALERFLEIALPLVDALAAAHEKGVIHRDLKPGNIMVGDDGRVRILDFGLAKLQRDGAEAGTFIDAEAETRESTRVGTVLGTAPYMSPEMVKGLGADARSDLSSLGVIFYELLCGRRPFQGDTAAELLSSILRDVPPPVSALRPELPAGIDRIVARCLEKAPDARFQTARALHAELASLARETSSPSTEARRPTSGQRSYAAADRIDSERSRSVAGKPSLAVVPFNNLSDDPGRNYFAKGLWADINSDLVRISGLFLISTMTTRLYADKEVAPSQVGRELNVRYVLMGTVRQDGNRVRITAELVDTDTGVPIWTERFDGVLDDLFALQDQITEKIVTALDVQLAHGEGARLARRSIKNPHARDLYYRAQPFVFADKREDLHEAQRLLEEAARLEPQSPVPIFMAAWAHYWEARLGLADSPEDSLARAAALAEEALDLDDPTGMAQMLKGTIHLMRGEHDRALEASEKALAHRPNCPVAYVLRGNIYNYIGKPTEAIDLARQGIRLTPFFPPFFPAVLATAYYLCDQPQEAADAARSAIALAPESLDTQVILAAALAGAGHADEAGEVVRDILRIDKGFTIDEFSRSQPYRDPATLDRLTADLVTAGLS